MKILGALGVGVALVAGALGADVAAPSALPLVDLAGDTARQFVVDRDAGQYLGHPSTVLLEDDRTLLCVYPKGHGKGAIQLKRSRDGGRTWSQRLPVPENWASSLETPTIHRVIDAAGHKRLIVWSGLYPARMSVSENDGDTWTPLTAAGEWGGIVVMSSLTAARNEPGHYLGWFHDDDRFFRADSKQQTPVVFHLFQVESRDGGLSWAAPRQIAASSDVWICEPGVVRSPDGATLALLLREESRKHDSQVIFSRDEGRTWSASRPLPVALRGDRHVAAYGPDGRLFVTFRDTNRASSTVGDWVGWVGRFDDLAAGRAGEYRVRLMHNTKDRDCAYSGLAVQRDGTFIATTYGHWVIGEAPYIVTVRFTLAELDARRQ
jgi:hypothetical protein